MKISISFLDFSSTEELSTAIAAAVAQDVSVELELLVCDPGNVLEQSKLDSICKAHSAVLCTDPSDCFGILQATGDYIAICKAGYNWRGNQKLCRQLAVLEADPSTSLVIHDVELLKQDGRPVDQNIRNRFIRTLGFEARRYGLRHLRKFDNCGFFGTWMFRNIFLNEKERTLYKDSSLDPELRLITLLIANGEAENLIDDRFVSCLPSEKDYQQKVYPKYNSASVDEKVRELEALQALLKTHYDIEIPGGYRRLHIANGAFNEFTANKVTEESVQYFLSVFNMAYRPEYRDLKSDFPEKDFFYFLRDKIRKYIAHQGTVVCLPLLPCIDGTPDYKWSYAIRDCKNKAVREAMLNHFETLNEKARTIIKNDRRKANPVRVFFGKVTRKLKKIWRKVTGIGKRFILWRMRKKGYSDYMSREWYNTVLEDLRNDKNSPLKHKLWCYRRGFTPWRVKQYGLDKTNFHTLPSDRDYMYLHQMNNSYKKWIEDKMTFRLVLDPFKEHLPKYYFQILQRDDRQMIVRLPDCPDGFEPTFDELLRLLRQEGKLALKAASGTHGVGFYKMHYEDGKYYLNNKETSEYGILNTINSFKSFYIVTNYINMHDQIKEIYAGSVNTIRIMMINRDGHHPQLMDAYMRIGSKKSGVTDNVAFGGVVCSVNMETGEYSNGMQLKNHVYIPIDCHPDTGTPLQGIIPNWDVIKKGITDISAYMCQLEYLGFDVVCTPEGFTVLEINSHQDLHRLPYYDPRVRDFLFYKLGRKERRYHIHRRYR